MQTIIASVNSRRGDGSWMLSLVKREQEDETSSYSDTFLSNFPNRFEFLQEITDFKTTDQFKNIFRYLSININL